jgi:hypothetical protein
MKKLFTTCRVIETEKEFRENPKVIELLDDPRIFQKDKNVKIFVTEIYSIENNNSDIMQVAIGLLDNPKSINNIRIESNDASSICITKIKTAEKYKFFLGEEQFSNDIDFVSYSNTLNYLIAKNNDNLQLLK